MQLTKSHDYFGYDENKKRGMFFTLTIRYLMVLVFLLGIAALFYWLQIRPSQIRHDCSWVEYTINGQPAYPAMTEAQLKARGYLRDCSLITNNDSNPFSAYMITKRVCESENTNLIAQYQYPRAAIPPKPAWRPASQKEYDFCLHDKGL